MATEPKKPARYDLMAADRRRNIAIQVGLAAIVVMVAVALVFYIVTSGDRKPTGGEAKSVRVASNELIIRAGTTEPKAVLGLYEDFQCPVCGQFEQQFGPTINNLINSGDIAADYYMVAILDRPTNQNYPSRDLGSRILRRRRGHDPRQASIPALPRRALRPAAQRIGHDISHQCPTYRDRASSQHHG